MPCTQKQQLLHDLVDYSPEEVGHVLLCEVKHRVTAQVVTSEDVE